MITARVTKKQGKYYSFSCEGHAEYEDAGKDIVCSAVSMLVINTANSIEKLTENAVEGSDKGSITWRFKESPDEKAELLMDAMLLGLKNVREKYGNDYLKLIIEEV
ncbi:MAG: ribosomal-processing cysteine protease Prp [Lachnospiraceae bacterium]|nr:ribosomal-processing cysteine protease Prp [Lachnospiraceae bacterium]